MITTRTTIVKCAFCRGRGKDPFALLSELATCQVCHGEGEVVVGNPYGKCPFCQGTGVQPHGRMVCTVCGGKGVTMIKNESAICPDCVGLGKNKENDLPCSACGGDGHILKLVEKRGGVEYESH